MLKINRRFVLTDEIAKIIDSNDDQKIINAFAGTGKTTTLVHYAKSRPNKKFLYIAYNKSAADDAKRKFPKNVECRTSHSLAYASFGSRYRHKLGNLKAFYLTKLFDRSKNINDINNAMLCVNSFIASRDREMTLDHVPKFVEEPNVILECARTIWSEMCSTRTKNVPMTHDGYLKLFQLANSQMDADVIMLDEAQDSNASLYDVFINQQANKIAVGDTHQNIYDFRGSINVMGIMEGCNFSLTQSFRFGQEIADVANKILHELKTEKELIKGTNAESFILETPDDQIETCYLHRTNATLFKTAVQFINQPINLVGGVDNYSFDVLEDTYHLYSGNSKIVAHPFIKSFRSFSDLESYARKVDDKEILSRIQTVKEFGDRIPSLITRIAACQNPNARVNMTTAHKSKGKEWDQVVIEEDFSEEIFSHEVDIRRQFEQEINLMYVAATRAKKKLVPCSLLRDFLKPT